MSVTRQLNVISQMRLDVSHIRLLESGVTGDFDVVVGRAFAGGQAVIVRGFTVVGSVGAQANTLTLDVADGMAVNLNASESGSFLWIPTDRPAEVLNGATNGAVSGAFVSSSVNYVGIDFTREADDATTDLVKFIDPVTEVKSDRLVPLGTVLNYRIVISTAPFSSQVNVTPIAKVTVSSTGIATVITDARQLMFGLGSGGDAPDSTSSYGWPAGRIQGGFTGGDKSLASQKDWSDAIMTRLWELGGGANWFSDTADRNVHMVTVGAPFTNGDYLTFDSGTGATSWQGFNFLFDGTSYRNEVAAGSGIIPDLSCLYVDLDRTANRTGGTALVAAITSMASVGTGSTPGSRWVIAWRLGTALYMRDWRYPVGTTFTPATTTAMGVVKLNKVSPTPSAPVVVSITTGGGIIVAATSGNTNGATFTGMGDAYGVSGEGVGGFAGVYGFGSSHGVKGNGDDYGVYGIGDTGGVYGAGRAGNAPGGVFLGIGTGTGVQGTGGAGGVSVGVRGIAGATANSQGVLGTAANGFGVVGNATIGIGVSGTGTTYGVYATATTLAAVIGIGTGTAAGGIFTSAAGAGLQSTGITFGLNATADTATGVGVQGVGLVGVLGASGTGISGVYGQGTAGTTDGVFGAAAGTGAGVRGTAASPTEYGLKSALGHVGAPIASQFKFVADKTGVIIVDATQFKSLAGTSVLNVWTANTPFPYWNMTAGVLADIAARVNLPRGAVITAIEGLFQNISGGGATLGALHNRPNIRNVSYDSTTPGIAAVGTDITSGGVFGDAVIRADLYSSWIDIGGAIGATTAPAGRTGDGNSGTTVLRWLSVAPTSGTWAFGGFRITYTYTEVDFMG